MARQKRPGLSDFMQLAQGFGNVAQQYRQNEANNKRMEYMDQQQEHMTWQREEAAKDRERQEQIREAATAISDHFARGGKPGAVPDALPGGIPKDVQHDATVHALKTLRAQQNLSEASIKAETAKRTRELQEFQTLVQRGASRLELGDTDGFYDISKVIYNNYLYDGQRVKDIREDPEEGRILTIETVDGQTKEVVDDMSPQELLQMFAAQAQNPEEFIKSYGRAKQAVANHNAEALQWENLEQVTDTDGNILYRAKTIDPESFHPVSVYMKEGPDGMLRPVDVEGQSPLSKEELGLQQDAQAAYGSGIENLTTNQALSELEKFFFREGGLLGEVQRMTESPDEQYWVAQQKFNDIIRQAQAGETEATPYEAALMARDYVMRMEDEFWQEVAENPDNREQIEQDFREMFGYVPTQGVDKKELERRRQNVKDAGSRLRDHVGGSIIGP